MPVPRVSTFLPILCTCLPGLTPPCRTRLTPMPCEPHAALPSTYAFELGIDFMYIKVASCHLILPTSCTPP